MGCPSARQHAPDDTSVVGTNPGGPITRSAVTVNENAPMSTKREERKQRAEAERIHREHMKRAQVMRNRLFFITGVVVVAAVVWLGLSKRQQSGRVWSAEHGHFHDK